MLITIGVLAYNERKVIASTLGSLFKQSVFRAQPPNGTTYRWHVMVVPNGCDDDTAMVASESFARESMTIDPEVSVSWTVESIKQPGKSNAWNEFVHRLAPANTDVFVLIDADIEFDHPDTLLNCVRRLMTDDHVRAVVDLPLKDFTRKQNLSALERLSAQTSKNNLKGNPGISGQFYCARSSTLRDVWMPIGLSVEDGFLAAMIITNGFREAPCASRIARAENASHYFEGLTRLRDIIHHEVRIVVGTVLNCHLCWDTLLFLTPANGRGAGQLVKELNELQPDWYGRMMNNMIANRGRWVIPPGWVFHRFLAWKDRGALRRLIQLPKRAAVLMFDALVYWLANRKLRSGRAIGYW